MGALREGEKEAKKRADYMAKEAAIEKARQDKLAGGDKEWSWECRDKRSVEDNV